jgi:hypothetical protein
MRAHPIPGRLSSGRGPHSSDAPATENLFKGPFRLRRVDIKGIVRAFKYSQLEQRSDPKTGQRRVPPSIKFLALVVALGGVAVLFWVALENTATGDDAGTLEDPEASPGQTNATADPDASSPDAPSEGPPSRAAFVASRHPMT